MANRYWVGGTGTWDATSTTNWSATSGGAGGASVPTSLDNVYFDQSATYTVTLSGNLNCNTLTRSSGTVTFTGTGTLGVYAAFLPGDCTWNATGTITFRSSSLGNFITTGSVPTTFACSFVFNGTGSWTLFNNLITTGSITFTNGTLETYSTCSSISATSLISSGALARAFNLSASTTTITLSSATPISFAGTNFTFTPGASSIVATSTAALTFAGNGSTFYDVSFTGGGAQKTITGINTFNNLSVTAGGLSTLTEVIFSAPQTINGTLSTAGSSGTGRIYMRSSVVGYAQTLRINSASISDVDFRDIYVLGNAAPISGTRIGDAGGCRNITFATPKTVYWVIATGGNWNTNSYSNTSGGAVNSIYFPLPQDTVIFDNASLNAAATVTMIAGWPFGTINTTARTLAMTLTTATAISMYICGDLLTGTSTTFAGSNLNTLYFIGKKTQTIATNSDLIWGPVIDSVGGTVQLGAAFTCAAQSLTVVNGTFDTKNYALNVSALSSSYTSVRTIKLGSSAVTLQVNGTPISFTTTQGLTFDAGTSTISCPSLSVTFNGAGFTYYNVSFTNTNASRAITISGANTTFQNLTFSPGVGVSDITRSITISNNIIVNGTLSITGSTNATYRTLLAGLTAGTAAKITANAVSLQDVDIRDIQGAGAATWSGTRLGDGHGNIGITFDAPKTVYWNLTGAQNWHAVGWATTSGGTPNVNNFPLAQDTAIINNSSLGTSITPSIYNWFVGTIDTSTRTTAFTITPTTGTTTRIFGDLKLGTGITIASGNTGAFSFSKRTGPQYITSNGVSITNPVLLNNVTGSSGSVVLNDAFQSTSTITITTGLFDASSYNVTASSLTMAAGSFLRMGSATWTITGAGTVWTAVATGLYKQTANIILTNNTTTARTFAGGGTAYNKLTISGTSSTSTTTITGNNQFKELASLKTVAHTIAFPTGTTTIGVWSITGTVGNVVTLSGTGSISIAGAAVSGVDYLALGTMNLPTTSPAEFYAGANSTGGTNFTLTAIPAARTLYWVGGTGNWTDTTHWSLTSGGAGGEAVPRSFDTVIINSASSATSYTLTINSPGRAGNFNISGPASGTVTFAGSTSFFYHQSATWTSIGVSRTYTGNFCFSGTGTGKTFQPGGVGFIATGPGTFTLNGIGAEWTLLGNLEASNNDGFYFNNGTFNTNGYPIHTAFLSANGYGDVTLNLGSSTITLDGFVSPLTFGSNGPQRENFIFNAGTSEVKINVGGSIGFTPNQETFYNLSFTTGAVTLSLGNITITNNLTFYAKSGEGYNAISITGDITIGGSLITLDSSNAGYRNFIASNVLGTTRTITCASSSCYNTDFRDITIAGAGAPLSGTRIGNCGGNSGITFDTPKTVYWATAGSGLGWAATTWATSSGGTPNANNFPLAQDTAIIDNTGLPGVSTIVFNGSHNIGTINASGKTTGVLTLSSGTNNLNVYGNWISPPTGTTMSGTGTITFSGRTTQSITSGGTNWTQVLAINSPGGTTTLQDALIITNSTAAVSSGAFLLQAGTFNSNNYNVTLTGGFQTNYTATRAVNIGSSTWTLAAPSPYAWYAAATTATGLTVTGTGTLSFTAAIAKSFYGGEINYDDITIDQAGSAALTFVGNNFLGNISNSYRTTGATSIVLGTTLQTVKRFTAKGAAGNLFTITSTAASLVFTGTTTNRPNSDYISMGTMRVYDVSNTWYAGVNSTALTGQYGWNFSSLPVVRDFGGFFSFFS